MFPTSTMESLLRINFSAVALIRERKYDEACSLLEEGFRCLDRMEDEADNEVLFVGSNVNNTLFTPTVQPVSVSPPSAMKTLEDLSTFSLYSKAFIVLPRVSTSCARTLQVQNNQTISDEWRDLMYIVFLYNIGLSFHLSGYVSGNTEQELRQALIAYETALGELNGSKHMLLELGILNNISFIYHQGLNKQETQLYIDRMKLALYDAAMEGKMNHPELMCFCENVIYNQSKFYPTSPAA